ncbi:MAG: cohesin domain-containing protein [Saprospiraceae bacterium]|nr:hypothetical protein [Lewinellaceae bacterium]
MIQRSLLLLVGLWLFAIPKIFSQVGFSLPVLNEVSPGSIVTLPVKVFNFDSITGAQFVIQWDPQVLSLATTLGYNLPNMTYEDFGLGDAPEGLLRFAWESPSGTTGYSAPDGTTIFLLKFSVVGQNNQGTFLTFTEDAPQTIFEVTQATSQVDSSVFYTLNDCILNNGYVAVGFTLSTDWLSDRNTLPVTVSPNPFAISTTATFSLESRSEVHMVLTDAAGHPVFERKATFPAGQHGMEIASDRLKENGIYYLILRTATQSCIRPLVKF